MIGPVQRFLRRVLCPPRALDDLEFKVRRLTLDEHDLVVLVTSHPISQETAERLKSEWHRLDPGRRVAVLAQMDITVLSPRAES